MKKNTLKFNKKLKTKIKHKNKNKKYSLKKKIKGGAHISIKNNLSICALLKESDKLNLNTSILQLPTQLTYLYIEKILTNLNTFFENKDKLVDYNETVNWQYYGKPEEEINKDKQNLEVKKIPFFSQYHNFEKYCNPMYMDDIKVWQKQVQDIFLIYQNIYYYSESQYNNDKYNKKKNNTNASVLFRPQGFYINPNIISFGDLEGTINIYEYEYENEKFRLLINQKKINDISWHHGQYSSNKNHIFFEDLKLKKNEIKLYYVEFNVNTCNNCRENYPKNFRAFYILNSNDDNHPDANNITIDNINNFIKTNNLIYIQSIIYNFPYILGTKTEPELKTIIDNIYDLIYDGKNASFINVDEFKKKLSINLNLYSDSILSNNNIAQMIDPHIAQMIDPERKQKLNNIKKTKDFQKIKNGIETIPGNDDYDIIEYGAGGDCFYYSIYGSILNLNLEEKNKKDLVNLKNFLKINFDDKEKFMLGLREYIANKIINNIFLDLSRKNNPDKNEMYIKTNSLYYNVSEDTFITFESNFKEIINLTPTYSEFKEIFDNDTKFYLVLYLLTIIKGIYANALHINILNHVLKNYKVTDYIFQIIVLNNTNILEIKTKKKKSIENNILPIFIFHKKEDHYQAINII
jgi:hypothetical protein